MLFGINQYGNNDFEDEHPLNEFYIQGFRGNNRNNPVSSLRSRSVNGSTNEEANKTSIMSDTENARLDEDFQVLIGHMSDVNTLDVSSSNELIVSGSNDATVRIWKLTENGDYRENTSDPPFISPITDAHSYGINSVRFSPFSTTLATGSTDGRIILWSTQTGKESFVLYHPSEQAIRCLSFSPNSELLASGSDDETVCIWDLRSRLLCKCLRGPEAMITAITFTNDSFGIIAGSSQGDLWYYQASGLAIGKKLCMVQGAHDMGKSAVRLDSCFIALTLMFLTAISHCRHSGYGYVELLSDCNM